jgi:uncharacterized protein
MIRVVFDTNVLFSAVLKRAGLQAAVFDLVFAGTLIPCVSEAVLAEYNEVLFRPVLKAHAARAREILSLIANIAVHVTPTDLIRACSDPDDDCFLECAEAAQADYLISGNKRHFPKRWKKTEIVNAREFLASISTSGK